MKELLTRTGTSVLFVAILVSAVLWDRYSALALFLVFHFLACREYAVALGKSEGGSSFPITLLHGILAYAILCTAFILDLPTLLTGLLLLFPIALILELPGKAERPFRNAAVNFFGPLYFGLGFASLIGIREHELGGPYILLVILLLVWVHDSAAYLFGKMLGRHKLWPRISPGKSWEGSSAGALFAFLLSWLLSHYGFPGWSDGGMPSFLWVLFPAIVVLFGTLGDLSISLFKRSIGIKDTGHLLPGHGGVLDRFDALLMSAPFLLFLLELYAL